MPDEPTLGELWRVIESLRRDIRDDFAQISGRLDRLVPLDVYRADQRAAELRTATVEQRVTAMEQRAERRPDRWIAVVGVVIALLALAAPLAVGR
jgi:UDP-N-acetylmuramate-alanine ligase